MKALSCGFLLVLLLFAAGCGRMLAARPVENPDYAIGLTVQPDPPAVGPARLIVTVADRQGKPVAAALVRVEGDMTHAGMAPLVVEVPGGDQGRTSVAFRWSMDGDWVVDVRITLAGGRTVGKQFPVRVGK